MALRFLCLRVRGSPDEPPWRRHPMPGMWRRRHAGDRLSRVAPAPTTVYLLRREVLDAGNRPGIDSTTTCGGHLPSAIRQNGLTMTDAATQHRRLALEMLAQLEARLRRGRLDDEAITIARGVMQHLRDAAACDREADRRRLA